MPPGAHVLVMTHDHAEDHAIIDAALRQDGLATIGLIGSTAKWGRFRKRLLAGVASPSDLSPELRHRSASHNSAARIPPSLR